MESFHRRQDIRPVEKDAAPDLDAGEIAPPHPEFDTARRLVEPGGDLAFDEKAIVQWDR